MFVGCLVVSQEEQSSIAKTGLTQKDTGPNQDTSHACNQEQPTEL
jgi:hypothetical protein